MAYFLSPALARLRLEVNALWPGRSKVSDGWIGDTAHSARKSDHNPDYSAGGIVRAIDITNDGIDVDAFVSSVIRDPRTRYVITRGRIWTRENGWQKYTGPNGHYHHVHVSVRTGGGYDMQIQSWGLSTKVGNNLGGGGPVTVPSAPPKPAPVPITPEDDLTPEQDAALAAIFRNQARIMQILEALDVRTGNLEKGNLAIAAKRVTDYVDAKTSDVLKETKGVRTRTDRYLDSKNSETLSGVRDLNKSKEA